MCARCIPQSYVYNNIYKAKNCRNIFNTDRQIAQTNKFRVISYRVHSCNVPCEMAPGLCICIKKNLHKFAVYTFVAYL